MQLEEFVRDTIRQVILGIQAARDGLQQDGIWAAINPVWKDSVLGPGHVLQMEFDVAVTVAEGSQTEVGGGLKLGIQVVGLGLGAKDKSSTETSSVSRVKFSVPYIPPSTGVDREEGLSKMHQAVADKD
jgi:hypothetical protein